MAGTTVHTVSISWASTMFRADNLLKNRAMNAYETRVVIRDRSVIAWS